MYTVGVKFAQVTITKSPKQHATNTNYATKMACMVYSAFPTRRVLVVVRLESNNDSNY